MPRVCTVCVHPARDAIDAALVSSAPARAVASRYGTLGRMAVQRHKDEHLPATLTLAHDAQEVARADDLLGQVRELQARTLAILAKAEKQKALTVALQAIREARANTELLAKLLGELDDRPQVNLILAPEWIAVRSALLVALGPYPDARTAVAESLSRLEVNGVARH